MKRLEFRMGVVDAHRSLMSPFAERKATVSSCHPYAISDLALDIALVYVMIGIIRLMCFSLRPCCPDPSDRRLGQNSWSVMLRCAREKSKRGFLLFFAKAHAGQDCRWEMERLCPILSSRGVA